MDKTALKRFIDALPLGKSISFTEAEKRAGMFLEAMALVTDARHLLAEQKIKALTTQTATYAEELQKNNTGSVMAAKAAAEASKTYAVTREDLEEIENDMSYLKAMYDIFMAAHVFYRQLAKGEVA